MKVSLTAAEIRAAADVGVTRRLASMLGQMRNSAGYTGHNDWQMDIIGAIGEMALAKALGVYWTPGVNTFQVPDVGQVHVRATTYRTGNLILRDADPAGVYALVIVSIPRCLVVGWEHTDALRQERYRSRPAPQRPECWTIPASALKPVHDLRSYQHKSTGIAVAQ